MQESINIDDQFRWKISNNMNVLYTYSRKHAIFIKKYNDTYKNLQVTYKIFEKIYLYSPKTYNNLNESSR